MGRRFTFLSPFSLDINILYQINSLLDSMSYDRFLDERLLTSRDALNRLQIKIKVLEIDENATRFFTAFWTQGSRSESAFDYQSTMKLKRWRRGNLT